MLPHFKLSFNKGELVIKWERKN